MTRVQTSNARPHPRAAWTKGNHGVGHIDAHGDVVTLNVDEPLSQDHARWLAPHDAYAHFLITPGGHVDANMTGPMGTTEFYRLLQQAHWNIAPKWTRSDELPTYTASTPDPRLFECAYQALFGGHTLLDPNSAQKMARQVILEYHQRFGQYPHIDDVMDAMKLAWQSYYANPGASPSSPGQYEDDTAAWHPVEDMHDPDPVYFKDRIQPAPEGLGPMRFGSLRHLYHVAPSHAREQIQRNGLLSSTLLGGPFADHTVAGPGGEPIQSNDMVWTWDNGQSAWNYASAGEDIWRIDARGTDWHKRPITHAVARGEGVFVPNRVHPSRLTLLHPMSHADARAEPPTWATKSPRPTTWDRFGPPVGWDPHGQQSQRVLTASEDYDQPMDDEEHRHLEDYGPDYEFEGDHPNEPEPCGGTGNHEGQPVDSCDECADRGNYLTGGTCPECYSPNTLDHVDEHGELGSSHCLNCGHHYADWEDYRRRQQENGPDLPQAAHEQWAETHLPGYTGEEPEATPEWTEHQTQFSPGDRLLHQPTSESDKGQYVPHGEPYPVIYRRPDPNYLGAHHVYNPAMDQNEWTFHTNLTPLGDWHDLPTTEPPPGHTGAIVTADGPYGHTNWDTSTVILGIDNEHRLLERARKLVERGASLEQFADWALKAYIAPYNKQQIADARSWNEIPEEERLDHNYEDFKDKHGDNPGAMDLIHGLVGGPDVSDSQPDLIDHELVNWQEVYQGLQRDLDENAEFERMQQRGRDMGLGWATRGGDENDKMRDAIYRFHGALPDEELPPGSKINHPKGYNNINVHLPYEDARAIGDWPEQFISLDTRNAVWGVHFKKLIAPFMKTVNEKWPNLSPEDAEERAYNLMRHSIPQSERDVGKYDFTDPQVKNLIYSDPGVQSLVENGHQMRLHEFAGDLMHAIHHGTPHPYIPQMRQALQQRGYTPEEIERMMVPRWQWDEAQQKHLPINREPQTPPEPDTSLDEPGDLTMPEHWASLPPHIPVASCPRCHQVAMDEGTGRCLKCGYTIPYDGAEFEDYVDLDPVHPPEPRVPQGLTDAVRELPERHGGVADEELAPHVVELRHYLQGHDPDDPRTQVPADPGHVDDEVEPIASPDPLPGALSASVRPTLATPLMRVYAAEKGSTGSDWTPEGWDEPEPYSNHGDRCPMCKNHRLDETSPDHKQIRCPECGWEGERFVDLDTWPTQDS